MKARGMWSGRSIAMFLSEHVHVLEIRRRRVCLFRRAWARPGRCIGRRRARSGCSGSRVELVGGWCGHGDGLGRCRIGVGVGVSEGMGAHA